MTEEEILERKIVLKEQLVFLILMQLRTMRMRLAVLKNERERSSGNDKVQNDSLPDME